MAMKGATMLSAADLSIPMRALLAGARRKQPAMLDLIRQLVRAESPSGDKAAVDACVALAAARARGLGGRVKLHRVLQECPVVAHQQHRAVIAPNPALQPLRRLQV